MEKPLGCVSTRESVQRAMTSVREEKAKYRGSVKLLGSRIAGVSGFRHAVSMSLRKMHHKRLDAPSFISLSCPVGVCRQGLLSRCAPFAISNSSISTSALGGILDFLGWRDILGRRRSKLLRSSTLAQQGHILVIRRRNLNAFNLF